jgi:hypothetical protein
MIPKKQYYIQKIINLSISSFHHIEEDAFEFARATWLVIFNKLHKHLLIKRGKLKYSLCPGV